MKTISIFDAVGGFAENKDIARNIREKSLLPLLKKDESEIILDFSNVTGATQSFIHALLSDLIRQYDSALFERVYFKNCNSAIQEVINTVADYMEAS